MSDHLNKILITAKVHPYLVDYLTDKGFQVLYHPAISYDEVFQIIHSCVGLVVTTRIRVDQALLDQASELQWIARLGSGMEMIDVDYATHKGIQCVSSPEGNCDAVGDHAMGMLLSLLNNILKSNLELRDGLWIREKNRGVELQDKVVGIIGFGHTGNAFAQRLLGFGCKVLAYDKYKSGFGNEWVEESSMDILFKRSDIVSIHVPLTDETDHMVNKSFIESFAGPFYLINTSRGRIVNTSDVIQGMKDERILGVCLDVLENEKLESYNEVEKAQFEYLLQSQNAVLTPHIAGYSREASYKMAHFILKKLGI